MDKLNAELERFDVEQIKNIVFRFIYKHNLMDLLDDDRVSRFDRDKFNNEFNRYISPLYHAVYNHK